MIKKVFMPIQKVKEIREKIYDKVKPSEKRIKWIDVIMQGAIGATLVIAIINYIKHLVH